MSETLNIQTVSIVLPDTANDWQGDDKVANILKAPSAAHGGAITILGAWATNQAATTGGTAFALTLLNYGTAGTAIKSSGGTVGATVGGTTDHWAVGVPKEFTLVNAVLEAGEWLVLRKTQDNSSDPSRCVVTIQYVMGK